MTTSMGTHRAVDVKFGARKLIVVLEDGRDVAVPLDWFPRLERATTDQLQNWELIGPGVGIHWPDVDEHISVQSLLHPEGSIASREVREARSSPRNS